MAQDRATPPFLKAVSRPGIWLLAVLFLFVTFLQLAAFLRYPVFLADLTASFGLTRYTVERILYLLPITWAAISFGWKGGAGTSLAALACMLPRALFDSPVREDALVESGAVFLVGNLVSYSLESLRTERKRRAQLQTAQEELESHLKVIEANQRQLAALNKTSTISSQSLDLSQVFQDTADCVLSVMGVEIVLMYNLDEEAHELILASHRGISEKFAREIERLRIGEGFNGRVAETGKPLFVEDASEDPRLTRDVVREQNVRSQLIVPLKSKGKVVGTVCVAMRGYRSFLPEEEDLLTAISNQIGVAIENARLYQQERRVAEQLRTSEQRYRELFENAQDAILVHDMNGDILVANKACERLTGYACRELVGMNVTRFLTTEFLDVAREVKRKLLSGEAFEQPHEQRLVRKDGTIVISMMATSLVVVNGDVKGFQHIIRDVTEERQRQDNLQFLLRQITTAQEEERKRIARELHDDTIQALVVHCQQIYDLASVEGLPAHAISRLAELRRQANRMIEELRRLSQDLRPAALDRLGLLSALRQLASDTGTHSGIATEVKVVGVERRLPAEVELVLFRIAQEAMRNIWKHAQATAAKITVEFTEGETKVTVSDNGKGFDTRQVMDDVRSGKLGLAGMRERAKLLGGTLTVTSELGKGTTLIAELPV